MLKHLTKALGTAALAVGLLFSMPSSPAHAKEVHLDHGLVQTIQFYPYGPRFYGPGYYGRGFYAPGFYGRGFYGPAFYGRGFYGRGFYGYRGYGGFYGRRFYR